MTMTNQILNFFRENLPHGRVYKIGNTVMSREELAGYLTGALLESGGGYEVFSFYVQKVGEFDVVYSDKMLRINRVVLAEDGDYDWIPYSSFRIS
jgi:hypothetical protein